MARVSGGDTGGRRSKKIEPPAEEEEEEDEEDSGNAMASPFLEDGDGRERGGREQQQQFPILAFFFAALRKSLVTCSVESGDADDLCGMDIGWPTDVRHVSHVTFDRFNGFLGLPLEFQPHLPRKVPSASVRVFGVSAASMQCSYDERGNSVPTILLLMQKRLYSLGGLVAEGIFRINADNSQEEYVRDQLNRGIIPNGIDLHCLAGLIKAWFRELPMGVLDSLKPEQVMHCNSEEDCTQLMKKLPPTEAALLDWAINLMADVVEHDHHNKMNARNIAMVFAPNMTQMADPLTALIHTVQVMNFLKTLILKTLQEREDAAEEVKAFPSCSESLDSKSRSILSEQTAEAEARSHDRTTVSDEYSVSSSNRMTSDAVSHQNSQTKREADEECDLISDQSLPSKRDIRVVENGYRAGYGRGEFESFLDRLIFRKGARRLCRHPLFQLSKPVKKPGGLGILNSRGRGEAWA